MLTALKTALFAFLRKEGLLVLLILGISWSAAVHFYEVPKLRQTYPGVPPEIVQRVPNNGDFATTFVIHIRRYYLFGEDFYLYFVRAKRIFEFGWVDNLLEPSKNTGQDFRNPVQVLVTALPALFGQPIQNLAIIYLIYLSLGIYLVYRASMRWIPAPWFAFLVSGAALFTFQERLLRLSTYALSAPVFIFGVSGLLEVYFTLRKGLPLSFKQKIVLGAVLLLLALWDAWAFAVLFSLTAAIAAQAAYRYFIVSEKLPALKQGMKSLGLLLAVSVFIYKILSFHIHPDVFSRAGFHNVNYPGFQWLHLPELFLWMILLAGMLYALRKKESGFFDFFILSIASFVLVLAGMVYVLRSEAFALSHFYYMYRFLWVWLAGISAGYLKPWELLSGRIAAAGNSGFKRGAALGLMLLIGAGWSYHYNSIFPDYFYPTCAKQKRFEKLLQFVDAKIPEQRGKSLLTLSHEANYLLAYDTKFDLLLPGGFALHSRKTNQEIINRFAAISHFLQLPAEKWNVFLTPDHPKDQHVWGLSRLLSERAGYLYYLFDRYSMRPDEMGPGGEQAFKLKTRLLQELPANPSQFDRLPDYVLFEDVAKFLDPRLPDVYDKIYEADGLILYRSKFLRS